MERIYSEMTPMERRAWIVEEALTWEGVPYVHGQQSRHGCDCIGLCIGVGKAVTALPHSYRPKPYPRDTSLHESRERLMEGIEACGGVKIDIGSQVPGDILVFQNGQAGGHAAIVVAIHPLLEIIHAKLRAQRVIRHTIHPALTRRHRYIVGAYTFPGVLP